MKALLKEYITTNVIKLATGLIGLNKKQASARMGKLKKIKDNVFEILDHIEFKAGEVIEIDPDKATLVNLEITQAAIEKEEAEKAAAIEAAEKEKQAAIEAGIAEFQANTVELDELLSIAKPSKADKERIQELEVILKKE